MYLQCHISLMKWTIIPHVPRQLSVMSISPPLWWSIRYHRRFLWCHQVRWWWRIFRCSAQRSTAHAPALDKLSSVWDSSPRPYCSPYWSTQILTMGLWMVLSSPLGLAAAAGIILLIAFLIYRYKVAWIHWLLRLRPTNWAVHCFPVEYFEGRLPRSNYSV